MKKEDDRTKQALERYTAVAPAAKSGMSREEASEAWTEIREMRARNVSSGAPDVSMRTLRRWAAAYRDEGLEGLYRKERSDTGSARALRSNVFQRAIELKEELPGHSVRQIIDIRKTER